MSREDQKGSLKLLTAPEVAAKLRWHVQTVYRNQDIPRIQVGGSVYFDEAEIDAWLRTRVTRKAKPRKRLIRRRLKAVENDRRQVNGIE